MLGKIVGVPFVLLICPIVLTGCFSSSESTPPVKIERTQTAKTTTADRTPESFCDKFYRAGAGPVFELPPALNLKTGKEARYPAIKSWTWLNVWATFCVPCRREMSALLTWKEQLARAGAPLELWFLSVDEEAELVRSYWKKNPELGALPSYLAGDRDKLAAAIKPLGLTSLESIPLHVLIAPDGKVRCVRAGALNDDDFGLVRQLVR